MANSSDFQSSNIFLEVRLVVFCLRNNRLQVMLVPADSQFFPGKWELPGIPVSLEQSLEASANQCLSQYIGAREAYLEQLYTYGDVNRHPQQRLVSAIYFALIPVDDFAGTSLKQTCAEWFPIEALPEMAMDHGTILDYALRRLRYKLEYTAVGFELLPASFTLTELQQTYEKILGEKIDKRNFRRRILEAAIIEPTPNFRLGEGRPARLYQYRADAVAEVKVRRLFPNIKPHIKHLD